MGDLSGTKLWSYDEEKNSQENSEKAQNLEFGEEKEAFKGTKIGSTSDFEKSLGIEPILNIKETPLAHEIMEEEKQQKTQIKEEKPEPKIEKPATPKEPAPSKKDVIEEKTDFQKEMAKLESDKQVASYTDGVIIKGLVRKIEKGCVMVDIKYKSEGLIPPDEISMDPNVTADQAVKEGQIIDVYIVALESKEGYTILSKRRADFEIAWDEIFKSFKERQLILEGKVSSAVRGGLVVDYKGIKGFVPASHVAKQGYEKLEDFINKVLPIKTIQCDRKRKKVVFSHKIAARIADEQGIIKPIESIETGQVLPGRVSSLKPFGAFVDIGGIEGLVHISELSWARVNHPREVLNVGDKVDVFVLGVDKENNKVSLGIKQLQPDPWVSVHEKYHVGQVITGRITRLAAFGAFIEVEKGLEGLIHISELSDKSVRTPEDVVQPGQEVKAKIIKILADEQKIGLSIKEIGSHEEKSEFDQYKKEETENQKNPTLKDVFDKKDKKEKEQKEDKEVKTSPYIEMTQQKTEEQIQIEEQKTESNTQAEEPKQEQQIEEETKIDN